MWEVEEDVQVTRGSKKSQYPDQHKYSLQISDKSGSVTKYR